MNTLTYGARPGRHGIYDLEFVEYMHFMYLPIVIPEHPGTMALPPQLEFAREMVDKIIWNEWVTRGNVTEYVYVTARRGFATPGNPLNRPGWHSDGFGTDDVNYVWTDRFPTLFAVQEFVGISDDHIESARQFAEQVDPTHIRTYADKELLRLDPSVIHSAPEIPAPGGERSFFKVSFSDERYNLRGNAHNYEFAYDWPMFDRAATRNDPAHAAKDSR